MSQEEILDYLNSGEMGFSYSKTRMYEAGDFSRYVGNEFGGGDDGYIPDKLYQDNLRLQDNWKRQRLIDSAANLANKALGFVLDNLPVIGSARDAIRAAREGRYGAAILHTVLAASDLNPAALVSKLGAKVAIGIGAAVAVKYGPKLLKWAKGLRRGTALAKAGPNFGKHVLKRMAGRGITP